MGGTLERVQLARFLSFVLEASDLQNGLLSPFPGIPIANIRAEKSQQPTRGNAVGVHLDLHPGSHHLWPLPRMDQLWGGKPLKTTQLTGHRRTHRLGSGGRPSV